MEGDTVITSGRKLNIRVIHIHTAQAIGISCFLKIFLEQHVTVADDANIAVRTVDCSAFSRMSSTDCHITPECNAIVIT